MNYLYLHGFASGPKSGKAEIFRKEFQKRKKKLHIPDLNGKNFAEMTISSQLGIITKIMKDNPGPFTLIGSSMGGFLAAVTAEKNSRVKKLVLMAPAFGFITMQKKLLGKAGITSWKNKGSRKVDHYYYNEKSDLNYSFFQDAMDFEKFRFKRQLPVMIFHGLDDDTVPYGVSLEYLKDNTKANTVLLHTDHSLGSEMEFVSKMAMQFLELKK